MATPAGHLKLALLGAESTGKSALAEALAAQFRARGRSAVVAAEYLRDWCRDAGRTPRAEEQRGIAEGQEQRVDAAAAVAEIVVADTTSLMVAVYSDLLFDDRSLYHVALDRLRGYDAVLVTGLDLPWVADGLFRDGPHVREPVDALLRAALARGGIAFQVVYGTGAERLANALRAIDSIAGRAAPERLPGTFPPEKQAAWAPLCEHCGDAECEHRLFRGLR